jgi:transcription termination/antitermination protein NusA
MEVIVDDSQLSLAIGKKGQNVRLAAKLIGWKIDIKSEEEKRQEVEMQMAALTVSGAPVSVLIDFGLTEAVAEQLLAGGVATVEKLGSMTPEEIIAVPGVGLENMEQIGAAVNAYYGTPYEVPAEGAEAPATEPIVEAEAAVQPEGEAAAATEPEAPAEAIPEPKPE